MPLSRKAVLGKRRREIEKLFLANGTVKMKWDDSTEFDDVQRNTQAADSSRRKYFVMQCTTELSASLPGCCGVQKCSWVQVYKRDPSIAVQHSDPDAISGFENVYTASCNKWDKIIPRQNHTIFVLSLLSFHKLPALTAAWVRLLGYPGLCDPLKQLMYYE